MSTSEKSKRLEGDSLESDRFSTKARLNLNDLLRRRSQERKVDKKANLLIITCVSAVAAVVFLILSL